MSPNATTELKTAFAGVNANFRGATDDPFPLYKRMRAESPVYVGNLMAELGVPSIASVDPARPSYTLFKHQDVMTVMRDSKRFTSSFIAKGLGALLDGLILTAMDGEEHKRARALLAPVFTPSAIAKWRAERIDGPIRKDFVEPLAKSRSEAELIGDMALLFPIHVIYTLIGFPTDDKQALEQFAAWALNILSGLQVTKEAAALAKTKALSSAQSLYDAIRPIVEQRRREGAAGDDLISRLVRVEEQGQTLDDHQIATFVRSLLPAAAETTTRTFGTVMMLLLERPDLLAAARANRALIPKVIDEAVRFEPAATFKVRQADEDVVFRGVSIPAGAMITCIVASANRDDDVFEDGDTFDPMRTQKPSFGFGFGAHACIGLFVAKAEIDAALNAILDLMPNIRIDPGKPRPTMTGLQLRGPHALHVRWD